jgi:hypothetical protein
LRASPDSLIKLITSMTMPKHRPVNLRASLLYGAIQRLQSILTVLFVSITVSGADSNHKFTQEELFDDTKILEVEITISEENWDQLRLKSRSFSGAFQKGRNLQEPAKLFEYVPADVSVNGVKFHNIGVKKKGFLGSLDENRPSLKIKLDKFKKGQSIAGLNRLTLNNNKQDTSQVHQYLAYKLFRDAGIPAPRLSFAKVTVNGAYLGVYSHVETIDKRFIKRNFGKSSGNLYEGTLVDFFENWTEAFETKFSVKNNKKSDLNQLAAALKTSDKELMPELKKHLDLDSFLRFWAIEVLVGHWDGYVGNSNNFFVYRPKNGTQFTFIPWGTDQIGYKTAFLWKFEPPNSVWAFGAIPHRIYNHEEGRMLYRQRMQAVLGEHWKEGQILGDIERLSKQLAPHLTIPIEGHNEAVERLRGFVETRRAEIQEELDGSAPEWGHPLTEPMYVETDGIVTIKFDTVYNSNTEPDDLNPFNDKGFDSESILAVRKNGELLDFVSTGAQSKPGRGGTVPRLYSVGLLPGPKKEVFVVLINLNDKIAVTGGIDDLAEGFVIKTQIGKPGFEFMGTAYGSVKYKELDISDGGRISGEANLKIESRVEIPVSLTSGN